MNDISNEEKSKYVFHQLVQKEGDYVGMIAYVLYKKNKIDYIIDFKNKNNNANPTGDDLQRFQQNHCVDGQLKLYRESAQNITTEFFSLLIDRENNKLEKRTKEVQKLENELLEKEKKIKLREKSLNLREKHCMIRPKNTFLNGVMQSLLATFIFLIISILIIYVVDNQVDILSFVRSKWQK